MAFMVPQYTADRFVLVEEPQHGERYLVPAHELAITLPEDRLDSPVIEPIGQPGATWFWRLSAPGYLDCTEWDGPYDTLALAKQACQDTHQIDPDTGGDLDEEIDPVTGEPLSDDTCTHIEHDFRAGRSSGD